MASKTDDTTITIAEAGELSGYSLGTINSWVLQGLIPGTSPGRGNDCKVEIPRDAFLRFLEARRMCGLKPKPRGLSPSLPPLSNRADQSRAQWRGSPEGERDGRHTLPPPA